MATTKHKLTFTNYDLEFELVFKSGKIQRFTYLKGKFELKVWVNLGKIIPFKESEIEQIQTAFEGKLNFIKIEAPKKSLHQEMFDSYYEWFIQKNDFKPKTNKVEGQAMSDICKYLRANAQTDEEALQVWQTVLQKWDLLEEFYRKQNTLRQINMNLQNIITELNNGKSSNNLAENIRESF